MKNSKMPRAPRFGDDVPKEHRALAIAVYRLWWEAHHGIAPVVKPDAHPAVIEAGRMAAELAGLKARRLGRKRNDELNGRIASMYRNHSRLEIAKELGIQEETVHKRIQRLRDSRQLPRKRRARLRDIRPQLGV